MSIKKNGETKKMGGNFQELLKQIKKSDRYEVEVVRDLVSDQIHRAMVSERISKAEFARKLNTSPPYITKLLQGNGNFTIETLVKIAGALGYKFRPLLIPMNQDWKMLGEFTDSANFEQIDQTITKSTKFDTIKSENGVELGTFKGSTEKIEDGCVQ